MSAPDDIYERIENRLVSHGVYVTEMERAEESVAITYETVHDTGVPKSSIGRVVNLLREVREDGWDPVRVEGTATDLDGDEIGTWHAEAEWFRELADDDITETEFSQRVLSTVDLPEREG